MKRRRGILKINYPTFRLMCDVVGDSKDELKDTIFGTGKFRWAVDYVEKHPLPKEEE